MRLGCVCNQICVCVSLKLNIRENCLYFCLFCLCLRLSVYLSPSLCLSVCLSQYFFHPLYAIFTPSFGFCVPSLGCAWWWPLSLAPSLRHWVYRRHVIIVTIVRTLTIII